VICSFDLTSANVHNVYYLKDAKYVFSDCELIAGKGYISAHYRQDLFTQSQIRLYVPARKNQLASVAFSRAKRRKRIETPVAQIKGQFSLNVNFAELFEVLAVRIRSKITALTLIQYLNFFVFQRSMNIIKKLISSKCTTGLLNVIFLLRFHSLCKQYLIERESPSTYSPLISRSPNFSNTFLQR